MFLDKSQVMTIYFPVSDKINCHYFQPIQKQSKFRHLNDLLAVMALILITQLDSLPDLQIINKSFDTSNYDIIPHNLSSI